MLRSLLAGTLVLIMFSSARAAILWEGDAANGTSSFRSAQPVNGVITVVDDPALGKVFKLVCHDNDNTKARCELSGMRGFTPKNNGEYFFGWKQKWGPLPTKKGKWQVLTQIHLDGAGAPGGPVPFGLSVPGDGKMYVNAQDPKGKPTAIWQHDLPIDEWHSFVYHIKFSESVDSGWMEIWYDGVPQTMYNGKLRAPCAMAHANSTSYWKWGIYRSGSGGPIGDSTAYLWRPRAGTTYDDVAPDPEVKTASP